MTQVSHAAAPRGHHGRGNTDDAFRTELDSSALLSPLQDSADRPAHRTPLATDIVEVWGFGSFPASDPPANW